MTMLALGQGGLTRLVLWGLPQGTGGSRYGCREVPTLLDTTDYLNAKPYIMVHSAPLHLTPSPSNKIPVFASIFIRPYSDFFLIRCVRYGDWKIRE